MHVASGLGRRCVLRRAEAALVAPPKQRFPPPVLTSETPRLSDHSSTSGRLPGDTIEALPQHFAVVSCTTLAAAAGCAHAAAPLSALSTAVSVAVGLTLADLFSGVFHWATDNYGNLDTPVFGQACAAFQGHHSAPWTITYRPTANNVHKIAAAALPAIAAVSGFLFY